MARAAIGAATSSEYTSCCAASEEKAASNVKVASSSPECTVTEPLWFSMEMHGSPSSSAAGRQRTATRTGSDAVDDAIRGPWTAERQ